MHPHLFDLALLLVLLHLILFLLFIVRHLPLSGLLLPQADGIADELRVLLDQVLEAPFLQVLSLRSECILSASKLRHPR